MRKNIFKKIYEFLDYERKENNISDNLYYNTVVRWCESIDVYAFQTPQLYSNVRLAISDKLHNLTLSYVDRFGPSRGFHLLKVFCLIKFSEY